MNTLANHDFVPHNGRNITRAPFIKACKDAFNVAEDFANQIFDNGVPSNPTPNATVCLPLFSMTKVPTKAYCSQFFDLDMLHKTHGFIEHDGSLSRKDIFFDPSNAFDKGTFDNLVSYFGRSRTFNISALANARARHALKMSLINPEFEITQAAVPVIMGENAMMLAIFGHPETQIANKAFFEFFFSK